MQIGGWGPGGKYPNHVGWNFCGNNLGEAGGINIFVCQDTVLHDNICNDSRAEGANDGNGIIPDRGCVDVQILRNECSRNTNSDITKARGVLVFGPKGTLVVGNQGTANNIGLGWGSPLTREHTNSRGYQNTFSGNLGVSITVGGPGIALGVNDDVTLQYGS